MSFDVRVSRPPNSGGPRSRGAEEAAVHGIREDGKGHRRAATGVVRGNGHPPSGGRHRPSFPRHGTAWTKAVGCAGTGAIDLSWTTRRIHHHVPPATSQHVTARNPREEIGRGVRHRRLGATYERATAALARTLPRGTGAWHAHGAERERVAAPLFGARATGRRPLAATSTMTIRAPRHRAPRISRGR